MAEPKKLTISVVTPGGTHSEHQADILMAETSEGQVGILPDHTPIIAQLQHGELIIRNDKETTLLATGAGMLEVNGSQITVLVDSADQLDDLDEKKILEAKKQAEEIMEKQKDSDADFAVAEADLRKSLNQLKTVRKWKKVNS